MPDETKTATAKPAAKAKVTLTVATHTHASKACAEGDVLEVSPAQARAMTEGDNPIAKMGGK